MHIADGYAVVAKLHIILTYLKQGGWISNYPSAEELG